MGRSAQNQRFVCENCGLLVKPLTNGSYRNHCPTCLYSKHVDVKPGDRASSCGGLMLPIGLDYRSGKGQVVVHRCRRCGFVRVNRVAENSVQPDDIDALILLSIRHGG